MYKANVFKEVLVSEEQITEICNNLAQEIDKKYEGENDLVLAVGLLKGCVPFMTDLLFAMETPVEVDFMDASSYAGAMTPQTEVQILKDLSVSVKDRRVLIVEDIIDTGKTLTKVKDLLLYRGAKSVDIVTMIDKPGNRVVEIDADFVGKTLGNEFLVGYGLDYAENFRFIRAIGIPTEEILEEVNEQK